MACDVVMRDQARQAVMAAMALGEEGVKSAIETEAVLSERRAKRGLKTVGYVHHVPSADTALYIDPTAWGLLRESYACEPHDVRCAFGRVIDVREVAK